MRTSAQERKLLLLLATVQFTHVLDFVIMMPLGPQLMRAFEIGPREFSLLVSAYQFSASMCGFLGALFLDRYGRKSAMLFLYVGFLIGTLMCALAPRYEVLLLARILAGAFGGLLGALVFSVIGDQIPESRRGAATGTVMASFSVASVVGVPLGLFLANHLQWHAPFVGIVVVGIFVIAAAARWLPSMREHLVGQSATFVFRTQWRELQAVMFQKNHQIAFALTMVLMFGGFSLIPFIAPFMVFNVGLPETQLFYVYLVGGLCTFFTSPFFGRLSDRHGKREIFVILAVMSLVPIWILTHLPPLPMVPALLVSTFFMVLFSGRFVPAMAMVTASVDSRHRGSFMSLNSCFQQMAAGLASYMSGLIVTRATSGALEHFSTVGLIACGFTLFAILLGRRLRYGPAEEVVTDKVAL